MVDYNDFSLNAKKIIFLYNVKEINKTTVKEKIEKLFNKNNIKINKLSIFEKKNKIFVVIEFFNNITITQDLHSSLNLDCQFFKVLNYSDYEAYNTYEKNLNNINFEKNEIEKKNFYLMII